MASRPGRSRAVWCAARRRYELQATSRESRVTSHESTILQFPLHRPIGIRGIGTEGTCLDGTGKVTRQGRVAFGNAFARDGDAFGHTDAGAFGGRSRPSCASAQPDATRQLPRQRVDFSAGPRHPTEVVVPLGIGELVAQV